MYHENIQSYVWLIKWLSCCKKVIWSMFLYAIFHFIPFLVITSRSVIFTLDTMHNTKSQAENNNWLSNVWLVLHVDFRAGWIDVCLWLSRFNIGADQQSLFIHCLLFSWKVNKKNIILTWFSTAFVLRIASCSYYWK